MATGILRVWRGWTTHENADAYEAIVSGQVLPGIAARDTPLGSRKGRARRELESETEFSTMMIFDSLDDVRRFAGEDYETAYVPPEARAVLARFDEQSAHYEILLRPEL